MAKKLKAALAMAILMAMAGPGQGMPGPSGSYSAYGTEPFWNLRIAGGRMIYEVVDEPSLSVALPRPVAIRAGRRYATPRMTVEITNEGRCNDGMSDHYWSERVRIWFGRRSGRALDGCGGVRVSPPTLSGTRWKIVAIDGRPVSGDTYFLEFDEARLTGKAGCNSFSGTYSEVRPNLRPGRIVTTRMACPAPQMEHEGRVLRLLSGPMSMAFPRGDVMLLSGHGVRMRLESED
jgi:heat shock protein HslJ